MLIDLVNVKDKYNMNIKGVLHIGAHFGQEFKVYEELGIRNVIFFEPLPHTFKKLKDNIGDKSILYETALGNIVGNVEMYVESANQGMSSSILEPEIHKRQYPHIIFNEKITVPITKLDIIIENHNKLEYNFICIDVQGYELEVFKGSINTLNSIDYIISEINRDEVYKECTKVSELDSFLSLYNFERVETNWIGGTWGDALYIKRTKNE
jgi:FkbM family methyltransferase